MKTNAFLPTMCAFLFFLLVSCSFDYSDASDSDKDQPDIVMENVEYVRVRSAELQARFQAELAERYEERRLMQLRNFSFEQFGGDEEVNAFGRAGSASIEIDSLDMRLDNGVRIDVESEDMAIETKWLEWKDKAKLLNGGEEEEVQIYQESGTAFTGIGFQADARRRTWEFTGNVSGTYIYDDDEEEAEEEIEAAETVDGEEVVSPTEAEAGV